MSDEKTNKLKHLDIKKHLSSSDFYAFKQDQLILSDLEKFLEHIGSCDDCSDLLAKSMEEELISAPVDMRMNVINKAKHLDLQIIRNSETPSKHMRLFRYSLKVITASAAAIILLILTYWMPYPPNRDFEDPSHIKVSDMEEPTFTTAIRNSMDRFTNQIFELSNIIMNTEVIENDQKEE